MKSLLLAGALVHLLVIYHMCGLKLAAYALALAMLFSISSSHRTPQSYRSRLAWLLCMLTLLMIWHGDYLPAMMTLIYVAFDFLAARRDRLFLFAAGGLVKPLLGRVIDSTSECNVREANGSLSNSQH